MGGPPGDGCKDPIREFTYIDPRSMSSQLGGRLAGIRGAYTLEGLFCVLVHGGVVHK